jgi:formate dehydrogenase subunit delta
MNHDNLVKMANQIGTFFEAMPDRAEALDGIATHVRKFWAPRMREQMQAHYLATGGAGLKAIVIEAFLEHSILHRANPPTSPQKQEFDGASEA